MKTVFLITFCLISTIALSQRPKVKYGAYRIDSLYGNFESANDTSGMHVIMVDPITHKSYKGPRMGNLGSASASSAWGDITGTLTDQSDLATALNGKQVTITTGTTAQYFRGDLSLATFPTTTSSFTNSTNKNFVTDAQLTVIGNTSGTNSGDNAANSTYANDYRSANFVAGTDYLTPNGSAALLTSFPTLNQNTTGSAATLTTSRNIQGVAFNGSANIDIINGTGFVKATGTTISYDNSTYLTTANAASTYQPLDADLTTISGLTATTDNFLVSVASAWASRTPSQVRTTLGLVISTDVQAYDADLTTYAGITPSANVQTLLSAADYSAFRTSLGVAIGTNVQAFDADLSTYAGITPTTVGQNLIALTNPGAITFLRVNADNTVTARSAANFKTDLSLTIGTDVQAFDADLTTWSGITPGSNVGTFLATPSSANLRSALTDENGTGVALFDAATTPTFTTGIRIGGAAATNDMLAGNGTNYVALTTRGNYTSFSVSGSNATTTGQSLVDITGLTSGTLSNSTTYEVEAMLYVTTSAVTTGTQYAVFANGSGGAAVYEVLLIGTTTTNAVTQVTQSSATQQGTFLTTSGSSGIVWIKGIVTTRGSGTATISIQHLKVTSGTSTVNIGSWMKIRQLNGFGIIYLIIIIMLAAALTKIEKICRH